MDGGGGVGKEDVHCVAKACAYRIHFHPVFRSKCVLQTDMMVVKIKRWSGCALP